MKIVFVTNNYTPYKGGVVSSINFFKSGLEDLGHKVYILTLDFKNKPKFESEDIIRIKSEINFFYNDNPIAIPLGLIKSTFTIIKDLNIDLIHSHHPFFLGKAALKTAQKLEKPILFTHHTFYEHYAHNIPIPENIIAPFIKKFDFQYCQKVDHIIAPGSATKDYLIQNNITTPITTIPTGIDDIFLTHFNKKQVNKTLKLLTVSRFTKEKNISFLIECFSKLDQEKFEFNILGYGPEIETLKNKALSLNIKSINFIEHPTKEDLLKYYQTSDLFLFASKSDTQAIVLAEAMACGLPVISLDGPGQKDIVVSNKNGFIVNSENEFLEKIIQLFNNRNQLLLMQQQAFITSQNYNKNNIIQKLIDVYQNI